MHPSHRLFPRDVTGYLACACGGCDGACPVYAPALCPLPMPPTITIWTREDSERRVHEQGYMVCRRYRGGGQVAWDLDRLEASDWYNIGVADVYAFPEPWPPRTVMVEVDATYHRQQLVRNSAGDLVRWGCPIRAADGVTPLVDLNP